MSHDNDLTFAEVDEILRIVDEAPRGGELTLTVGSASLTLRLRGQASASSAPASAAPAVPAAPPPAPSAPSPEQQASTEPLSVIADDGSSEVAAGHAEPHHDAAHASQLDTTKMVPVKSPMVGVWYRSAAPGEPPFVEIGDTVEDGQQVGIIEVMKLMNRIVAPVAGVVRDICVDNEGLAEFGATLLWIEPAS